MAQLSSALKYSFAVARRRFVILWSVTVWPYLLMAAGFLIARLVFNANHDPSQTWDPAILWQSMGVTAKIGVAVAYLACVSFPSGFATAGASIVVWADLHGQEVDLRSVFSRISHVFLRLTVVSLCIGLACSIGGAVLYLPGILGFAFLSFAIPVLVIEDAKFSTALGRGINLASQRLGSLLTLYAMVLFAVIFALVGTFVVTPIVDLPRGTGLVVLWVLFLALVPLGSMATTAVVVKLYSDLRDQHAELTAKVSAA